ncbi:MAG: hypothetical protein LBP74_05700, partial [Treponema sp.]|nr:hypothetical protein [Treponema sp.]
MRFRPFPGQDFLFMVLILLFSGIPFLWADSNREVETDSEAVLQGSTRAEVMLSYTHGWTFPLFQGEGPLTSGNNLRNLLTVSVTPVSFSGKIEGIFTPIAFFQLSAGFFAGTGWNINFGNKVKYGLGLNIPEESRDQALDGGSKTSVVYRAPFDGLVWDLHGGTTLQFDTAAIWPGDWRHIVFRAYNEINYWAFTGAADGE